jgi:hypothetical protein
MADDEYTNGNGNLEYVEGLPQNRIPGAMVPEFHEVDNDRAIAEAIPVTQHDPATPKQNRFSNITMPSFVFISVNGDAGLNQPIPYGRANTVRVDNYSAQWCRVGGVFIQPGSYGWVIALDRAVTNAKLGWEAPPGQVQPAAVTGAPAYTTWYEERFPHQTGVEIDPGGGSSATLNTSQVAVTTGTLIIAANGARRTVTILNAAASGGNNVFIGGTAAVSTTTGGEIPPQIGFTLSNYSGAIYGSATGGSSTTVTVTEESA